MAGELFKVRTGLKTQHSTSRTYKGSAPAVTDLIGGQVHCMFDNMPASFQDLSAAHLTCGHALQAGPGALEKIDLYGSTRRAFAFKLLNNYENCMNQCT